MSVVAVRVFGEDKGVGDGRTRGKIDHLDAGIHRDQIVGRRVIFHDDGTVQFAFETIEAPGITPGFGPGLMEKSSEFVEVVFSEVYGKIHEDLKEIG